ncbi:MAG: permease, partial [Spirochaetales bacterium]|nr:permease [Spirochaetales bacterium]
MLQEFYAIAEFVVKALIHIWPYLLLTVPISVLIHLSGTSRFIGRAFSAKPLLAILLATIVGAFSPFCSCGVIPVISSLLIGGVPLAPVMSFWLASPSMDPEIFFLSVAKLGMPLAVARLTATFLLSLGAGYITHILMRFGWLPEIVLSGTRYSKGMSMRKRIISAVKLLINRIVPKPALASIPANSGLLNTVPQINKALPRNCETNETSSCTTNSSCSEKPVEGLFQKVLLNAGKTMATVMKFMLLAFFLEALIIRYVP